MSTNALNWYVDRSRIAAYRDCPRLRYLTYHYAGKGLQRMTLGLPLVNGDMVHKCLADLLQGASLEWTLAKHKKAYTATVRERGIYGETDVDFLIAEQLCLLEGIVRAFARSRLQAVLNEFTVVDVEVEREWQLSPTATVMLRQDAALRRKSDGLLFIKEWKTTSRATDDWAKKFQHDSQMLLYTIAAEEHYGEPIGGIMIEGLVKGARSVERAKSSPFAGMMIQQHPFCYAFKSKAGLYDAKWSYGAEKIPVWETLGIEKWLDLGFNDIDLNEYFIQVPSIKPPRRDLERWRQQAAYQEYAVHDAVLLVEKLRDNLIAAQAQHDEDAIAVCEDAYEEALNWNFPQNHNHCFRYFGHPCPMERACFTDEVASDPLGSGYYEPRVPHHTTEEDAA